METVLITEELPSSNRLCSSSSSVGRQSRYSANRGSRLDDLRRTSIDGLVNRSASRGSAPQGGTAPATSPVVVGPRPRGPVPWPSPDAVAGFHHRRSRAYIGSRKFPE